MDRKHLGGRRKRSALPSDRHKRASAYRHSKYVYRMPVQNIDEQKKTSAVEEIPVSLKGSEKQLTEKAGIFTERKLHLNDHKKDDLSLTDRFKPLPLEDSDKEADEEDYDILDIDKKSRKQIKKEKLDKELNILIDEPEKDYARMIYDPIGCMNDQAAAKHTTITGIMILILHIAKWILMGITFVYPLQALVNAAPFSTNRMNFTDISWFAIRIAIYGMLAEAAGYWIVHTFGGTVAKPADTKRVSAVVTCSLPLVIAGLLVSLIVSSINAGAGLITAVTVAILAGRMKFAGFEKSGLGSSKTVFLSLILTLLFLGFGWLYLSLFCGDIYSILLNILNL